MAGNPFAKYGLTIGGYERLKAAQNGACVTCRRTPKELNGRKLVVDHDHKTGLVRGLLCGPCNTAIGMVRENSEVLEAIAVYLGKPINALRQPDPIQVQVARVARGLEDSVPPNVASLSYDPATGAFAATFRAAQSEQEPERHSDVPDIKAPDDFRFALEDGGLASGLQRFNGLPPHGGKA